jgi:hypothetical protein
LINLTRSLARQLRAVFRRAGIGKVRGGYGQRILFIAAGDTLRIRALTCNAAIEYQAVHQGDAVEAMLPLDLLAACEGSRPDPVQLDFSVADKVTASWTDKRVPVVLDFAANTPGDALPPFPPQPDTFVSNEPSLWTALREAANTTDQDPQRFALGCVQLCGNSGRIAATNGLQALVQSGFAFPWTEDLLVPASGVFGCRELPQDEPIHSRQDGGLADVSRTGPWTVSLKLEQDARFPDVSRHIGDPDCGGLASAHRGQRRRLLKRRAAAAAVRRQHELPDHPRPERPSADPSQACRPIAGDGTRFVQFAFGRRSHHRQLEPRVPVACRCGSASATCISTATNNRCCATTAAASLCGHC